MLAAKGWQKQTVWAAGDHSEHIHGNCDCTYAVKFDDSLSYEGYNPDEYVEIFDNAEGETWEEKRNYLRRKQREDPEALVAVVQEKVGDQFRGQPLAGDQPEDDDAVEGDEPGAVPALSGAQAANSAFSFNRIQTQTAWSFMASERVRMTSSLALTLPAGIRSSPTRKSRPRMPETIGRVTVPVVKVEPSGTSRHSIS